MGALTYSIDQVSSNNWESSLQGLYHILIVNENPNEYFYNLGRDVLRVILIKVSCILFEYAFKGHDKSVNN